MMSSRPAGVGFRPSAPCGATAARPSFARLERRRSAPGLGRFPRPSAAFLARRRVAERGPMTDVLKRPVKYDPPHAEIRPTVRSAHGLTWTDDYAWIRAENWRDVLRDPGRLPGDIRALLEAENAYAEAALAPTSDLQKELVAEMRARLEEDDSEPPQTHGPLAYYS